MPLKPPKRMSRPTISMTAKISYHKFRKNQANKKMILSDSSDLSDLSDRRLFSIEEMFFEKENRTD